MEHTVSGVGVLDKAILLLGSVQESPASLGDLQERTGLSRATAHRLALALEVHGLLRRDRSGRFAPGLGLVPLGRAALAALPVAEVADPVVRRLRDDTGESAQLYVREGDERRCVLAHDSPHELRTIVAPGALLALGRGSAGRLLAGEPPGSDGWLETIGDRQEGVASVSAPVRTPDGVAIAAISVSGPIERIGLNPGRRHGHAVVAAARSVELALA